MHENILLLAFTTANVPLISQFWSRYPDHGRLHNEPQLNDNSLIQKCFQSRGQSPERGDKIFRFPAPPLWLVTRGEVSGLSTQCPQCRQCDQRGSMETSHRRWRGPSHADTSRHNITLQQTCRPCLTMQCCTIIFGGGTFALSHQESICVIASSKYCSIPNIVKPLLHVCIAHCWQMNWDVWRIGQGWLGGSII